MDSLSVPGEPRANADASATTSTGYAAGDAGGFGSDPRYRSDPVGYPTPLGAEPPWCGQGQNFDEVCGNDIDDDCDGTVDEFQGIGLPCQSGCGTGVYVCDTTTNALLCRGRQGCVASQTGGPNPCGDGIVGVGEECDPAAPNEQAGVTCTSDCKRPLFVPCIVAGVSHPEFCDAVQRCSPHVAACVPAISPAQPRCPNIPVESTSSMRAFYPMLETENGECWITCTATDQCPSSLSDCYMGFCVVPL